MPDPNALCRISSTESLEEVDSLKGPMSKQASSSDSVEELESFGEYSRLPLSIGPGFVETPFDNSNKLAVRVKFNSQTVIIDFLLVAITDESADLRTEREDLIQLSFCYKLNLQFTSFYCLLFSCMFAFLTTLTIVANKCEGHIKCVQLLTL